jgi:hypothetical protein
MGKKRGAICPHLSGFFTTHTARTTPPYFSDHSYRVNTKAAMDTRILGLTLVISQHLTPVNG